MVLVGCLDWSRNDYHNLCVYCLDYVQLSTGHEMASNKITNLSISQILHIPPCYGIMSYKILTSAIKDTSIFSKSSPYLALIQKTYEIKSVRATLILFFLSKIIVFDFYIYYFVYPSLPSVFDTSVHHLSLRRELATYRCKIGRHFIFSFSPFYPKQQSELVVNLTG
jgi:hypothetical protein